MKMADVINERLILKRVIRKGQVTRKWKTDREDYRVDVDQRTGAATEKKITYDEQRKFRRAARKRKRKIAGKKGLIAMKRKISISKRSSW